jgi:hypothetical protein
MRKPDFDKRWLAMLDPLCRKLAAAIWAHANGDDLYVIDGPERDIDQVIKYNNGSTFGWLEVEYVDPSTGRFFDNYYHSPRQDAVTIPIRKGKFFTRYKPSWWMNFSSRLTNYIIIPGDIILAHEVRKYDVYNNITSESFYGVPKGHPNTKPNPIPSDMRYKVMSDFVRERPDLHQMMKSLPLLYT